MIKSQVILGAVLIIGGSINIFASKDDLIGRIILIVIGILLIIFKDEESKIEKIKEVKKK